jgi:hypothetical protein
MFRVLGEHWRVHAWDDVSESPEMHPPICLGGAVATADLIKHSEHHRTALSVFDFGPVPDDPRNVIAFRLARRFTNSDSSQSAAVLEDG